MGARIRAGGTVGASNAEARFFEFLLPVALVLWLTAKRFSRQISYLVVFVVGFLGLFLTFSRGGMIGLITGVSVVIVISWMFNLISSRKFLSILFVTLLLGTILLPKFYQYVTTRPEAATARLHLIKIAVEIIKDHPFLGVGLNNHHVASLEYDPNTYLKPMLTHNQYLLIATEIGIPGLVFFVGFLGLSCAIALKTARGADDVYIAAVSVAIFGAYVAISMNILVDWIAVHTNHTLFWLYGGLSASLSRMNEMDAKTDSCAARSYGGTAGPG